ncbi:cell envelope integrity protein CreD [Luteimonas lutimaris]|uniref:Cell envelope integrity protein CreD n=1 Tax=Luteimonas lutimaris TaxID=698645 RepID=A0ABP7MSZ9_9GAMM|nr:cell envelope integrity protein CreD [Luteimonas sp.]
MRLGFKILMVLGLTLAILVPLAMIRGVIHEREGYRAEAVAKVARSNAGRQSLAGPVLVVPYSEQVEVVERDKYGVEQVVHRTERRQWVFFPKTLDVGGKLEPEVRRSGLYRVRVYAWQGHAQADFDVRIPDDADPAAARSIGRPYLGYAVGDVRGLRKSRLQVDGREAKVLQGLDGQGGDGVHARLPAPRAGQRLALRSRLDFTLAGTESLAVVPLGDNNHVALDSPWPHPSFVGTLSPDVLDVGDDGFRASWDRPALASNTQAQVLRGLKRGGGNASSVLAGVDGIELKLIDPVDIYTKADRATKYGLLFVALTFVGFFMFELIRQLRIHPVQYALVGLALAIFFLLLVSLSEHIEFGWAYLVASVACIGLLGFYLSAVLRSALRGLGFAVMLATLYAALYGLLVSEDNALVLGAGLLFVILAAVMVLTRKVDWYRLSVAG